MNFEPCDIATLGNITASFEAATDLMLRRVVLRATFHGNATEKDDQYPHLQMRGLVACYKEVVKPDSIILDFSGLTFEWNNEMAAFLQLCRSPCILSDIPSDAVIHVAVVTSNRPDSSQTELLQSMNEKAVNGWLVSNKEAAIDYIQNVV